MQLRQIFHSQAFRTKEVRPGLPDLFFQKRPTNLLKKAKHLIKKGQKRAKPFTWQTQMYEDLPRHNSNSHKNTSFMYSQHLHKKQLFQNYF